MTRIRRSRSSSGGREWLQLLTAPGRGVLAFSLIYLLVALVGCDSPNRDSDERRQLARAASGTEDGAFRNLGKRSAFDYGSVEAARTSPTGPDELR